MEDFIKTCMGKTESVGIRLAPEVYMFSREPGTYQGKRNRWIINTQRYHAVLGGVELKIGGSAAILYKLWQKFLGT